DLDDDLAFQVELARQVDLPHAAFAQQANGLVAPEEYATDHKNGSPEVLLVCVVRLKCRSQTQLLPGRETIFTRGSNSRPKGMPRPLEGGPLARQRLPAPSLRALVVPRCATAPRRITESPRDTPRIPGGTRARPARRLYRRRGPARPAAR